MKQLFLSVIAVLFALNAWAGSVNVVVGQPPAAAPAGDSCTGDLLLSAHFENSDTITEGTPAGCHSGADQTWSLTGGSYSSSQKSDGGYALYFSSTNDWYWSEIDVTLPESGTITFDFYPLNFVGYGEIFSNGSGNDQLNFYWSNTTNRVSFFISKNGTYFTITGGYDLTQNAWNSIEIKWRTSEAPYASLKIGANTADTNNTAIGAWGTAPIEFDIRAIASRTVSFYIDNLKIYSSWR